MSTGALIEGLPPGPRLPAFVQSLGFLVAPIRYVEWLRARYGDVHSQRLLDFGEILYVADPEVLKQVFTGDSAIFRAGESNEILGPITGPKSILLLDDEEHMRQRKLMLPSFHGAAIKGYAETIQELATAEVDSWPVGERFKLHPRMQAVTLEVIMRVIFGIRDDARLAQLRRLLPQMFRIGLVPLMLPPLRRDLGPRSPFGRLLRTRAAVDAILMSEVERRRKDPDSAPTDDVLAVLLAARDEDGAPMSDAELCDELVTLLLAGHETTATALAWAFERLMRHPQALARLRAELTGGDGSTEYLDAVIKETLRVRPIVMDVGRKLSQPVELDGRLIPAGTIVMPAIALVQLSERRWQDPAAFRPERFLAGATDPYTWIPFGGGRRRCAGAAFAQLEMQIIIGEIVRRTELRAVRQRGEGTRLHGVALKPARGAEAICVSRR